jgi:hypothetical protein
MQHKKRRVTTNIAIKISLLTCERHAAPHKDLLVFMVSVAHHHRVRVPARATGAKPKNPPRRAKPSAPLTHATTRAPYCVRRAQCVFGDDPDRPLTASTDPRRSASELHVLSYI